ncbi:hypothetical protein VTK73DRAFT_4926 [Phialemonium thermophilum]|uniref:R3H-associated N-terminal domain-containing protein n=1 Tax=Phialemonium thermophilum TaxID=223376 RepID=A0ABR3V588_9PEZI
MAIHSAVPAPPESPTTGTHGPPSQVPQHQIASSPVTAVDIESWTISALEALSVSPVARGVGSPLAIPLDGGDLHHRVGDTSSRPRPKLRNVALNVDDDGDAAIPVGPPRRPPSRRDSMRRRDALLKGKEGSRQRRRWENDRLLHVPNVEPPLPSDWEVRPTHPVHHVPYQLAQYWDKGLRDRVEERKAAFSTRRRPALNGGGGIGGPVSRDLRAAVKRTPAVKSWLRALEEPVRAFLVERGAVVATASNASDSDEDEEEIVFSGRNNRSAAQAPEWKRARRLDVSHSCEAESVMVLDSLGDDEGSSFKRWLTHSISDYYGLDSRSVTVGEPARRVVCIGVRRLKQGFPACYELPQPLWELF